MKCDNIESNTNNNLFNRESKIYTVRLKEFEGPLDLLLHLIKSSEVNIYDISISQITQQYLSYMSLLITLDLENVSEFIEMAATLIYIKSSTLLPVDSDFEEDRADELRVDLIQKLLEYQKYKIASGILEEMSEDSNYIVRKNSEPLLFNVNDEEDENWQSLSVLELVSAFAEVLNKKSNKQTEYEIEIIDFTVEEKITYLQDLLREKESFNYFDVINEDMSKTELICTFLAILELVKLSYILIRQHKIFGDIHIVRNMIPEDFVSNLKTDFDEITESEEVSIDG